MKSAESDWHIEGKLQPQEGLTPWATCFLRRGARAYERDLGRMQARERGLFDRRRLDFSSRL
jgi:hypothetical protein